MPVFALSSSNSGTVVSGSCRDDPLPRHHHVRHLDRSEIDHVMDHGALGRGQRALALAFNGQLFQILARGKETRRRIGRCEKGSGRGVSQVRAQAKGRAK